MEILISHMALKGGTSANLVWPRPPYLHSLQIFMGKGGGVGGKFTLNCTLPLFFASKYSKDLS